MNKAFQRELRRQLRKMVSRTVREKFREELPEDLQKVIKQWEKMKQPKKGEQVRISPNVVIVWED